MKLFDRFRKTSLPTQSVEIEAEGHVSKNKDPDAVGRGVFVMTDEGIGIHTGDGVVTLIKPDGTNRMMLDEDDKAVAAITLPTELVRAYIDDIPASRRGDPERLFALGYKFKDI